MCENDRLYHGSIKNCISRPWRGGVTVVENWVCAVLMLVASKRLNVNRMHFPLFTFGLFEAVFTFQAFFPRLRLGLL